MDFSALPKSLFEYLKRKKCVKQLCKKPSKPPCPKGRVIGLLTAASVRRVVSASCFTAFPSSPGVKSVHCFARINDTEV